MLTHPIVGRKRLSEPSPFGHWDRCLSAPLTGRHPTSDRPTPARRRSANPGFGTVASSRRRGSYPPTVTRACERPSENRAWVAHGVVQIPFAPRLPVRTARLVLRQFHAKDLEPLLGFHSDADAVRYVPYPPRDRQTMRTVLERKIANTRLAHDDDLLELAVVRTEDQVLIGDVLLVLRSVEHQTVEVGYIFSPAYSRQGYATEAVRALLEVAFFELGARRVVARVDARNTASRALLERLGMRQEANLIENEWIKGELTSEVDYAVLAREC
jgi:RimJ/RimL family protein N-acetyltransferase